MRNKRDILNTIRSDNQEMKELAKHKKRCLESKAKCIEEYTYALIRELEDNFTCDEVAKISERIRSHLEQADLSNFQSNVD